MLRPLGGAAVIAIATVLAYLPAIRGGFIWDDPDYVINNHTLRTPGGLVDMWTVPRSLPQWYPMVHTSFWIEYQLWGLNSHGYHVTNVLLHIASSLLLWRLLRVLEVPGAWLAGAVFALHPVAVESVAWITERKNVLSMAFYLLSLLAYLRYLRSDAKHSQAGASAKPRWMTASRGFYAGALMLFLAALLSKTVTATLPAAILVILWWKRGTVRWRDIIPLVPFFILGVSLGLVTAYLEATHVGASGERIAELNFTPIDRILIAGRVICFYAWKLVWPHPLVFIYPRWEVDPRVGWQWLFPAGVLIVLVLLVLNRSRWGRGPAAAAMLFCGTLFPALGFFDVYPMRFSYVADHFQYHASAALLAFIAAALWRYAGKWGAIVLAPLIVLTAMQTPNYADAETLWRATLERNEGSWMVHTNLAHVLRERADATNDNELFAEAERHYFRALELAPNIHDTHTNVGMMLGRRRQSEQAIHHFNEALKVNPSFAPAYFGIGQVYEHDGKLDLAEENYRKALQIVPGYPEANRRLAGVLIQQGQLEQAVGHLRTAATALPDDFDLRMELGSVLARTGQFDEAIHNFAQAARIKPDQPRAWFLLGMAEAKAGRQEEAARSLRRAIELDPSLAPTVPR